MTEYPRFFYKYRAINNVDAIEKEHAIDALINNYAVFSSRKNFNDLFDSKIKFIRPTVKEVKGIKEKLSKSERNSINELIDKGAFTEKGKRLIAILEKSFNKMIDSYALLSVSKIPTSNLMWSHYANSHKGFCLEFKSEYIQAEKVEYVKEVPELKIIEMLYMKYGVIDGKTIAEEIEYALRKKLEEWRYEEEYRYLAGNGMGKVAEGENFIKVQYEPEFLESVIFGCRTDKKVKEFIINHVPNNVKFKQAVERTSRIEVVDYKK